jgi:hypothetical protein
MAASAAHAQTVVYNNTVNFLGEGDTNGYDTSAANTIGYTYSDMDDINVAAGFGGKSVTEFEFTVANFGSAAFTVNPTITFYNTDESEPTSIIEALTFTGLTTPGSDSIQLYTVTTGANAFTIPASGSFWAGITFTGASAANLAEVGQGLFGPPTVGTTADTLFSTNNADNGLDSNPAGYLYTYTPTPPSTQPLEYGWEFEVAAAPEPSQYAAFGLGILGIGALALKARRRKITA